MRKSESRETTFAANVTDMETLHETLSRLAASVCKGLAAEQTSGRTITVKLRLAPFRTRTRSQTLALPTCDPEIVAATAHELLDRFDLDAPVRLVGVGISSLQRDGEEPPEESAAPELSLPI